MGFESAVKLAKIGQFGSRDLVRVCCNRLDYWSDDVGVWEILAQTLLKEKEEHSFAYRHKSDLECHLSWWTQSPQHFVLLPPSSPFPSSASSDLLKMWGLRAICAKLLGVELQRPDLLT